MIEFASEEWLSRPGNQAIIKKEIAQQREVWGQPFSSPIVVQRQDPNFQEHYAIQPCEDPSCSKAVMVVMTSRHHLLKTITHLMRGLGNDSMLPSIVDEEQHTEYGRREKMPIASITDALGHHSDLITTVDKLGLFFAAKPKEPPVLSVLKSKMVVVHDTSTHLHELERVTRALGIPQAPRFDRAFRPSKEEPVRTEKDRHLAQLRDELDLEEIPKIQWWEQYLASFGEFLRSSPFSR